MSAEFGSQTFWIVFMAITLGNAGRVLLPYWDKIKSGEIDMFEKKFLATAVIAYVGTIVPSLALFPVIMEQIGPYIGMLGLPSLFFLTLLIGYGGVDLVNTGLKLSTKKLAVKKLDERIDNTVLKVVDNKTFILKEEIETLKKQLQARESKDRFFEEEDKRDFLGRGGTVE